VTRNPLVRLMGWLTQPAIAGRSWWIPTLPAPLRPRHASPRKAWPPVPLDVPPELLTVPGIRRDREAEQNAFEAEPLQLFHAVHAESLSWEVRAEWRSYLPVAPRQARADRAMRRTWLAAPPPPVEPSDEAALTAALKQRAAELGFGAAGVASYDPKYTFAQYTGHQAGERVVVLVLEQHYGAVQETPSVRSNRSAYDAEADGMRLTATLAGFLHRHGYRARAHNSHEAATIPYAVEAGLGQLGLNGQLLTPHAGSRCRLTMLTTDAPLVVDHPVDFGIHGLCDRCLACVERCPVGAIPSTRRFHRGVEKAKINTARCFPTVAQVAGCGVCMKVCPVQRYGLRAVLEEYARSGTIKGRGTDDLEGYDWPPDDAHIAPAERPRLGREFFKPEGLNFDPARKLPVAETSSG
jgi:epoxyqueuosine reductase